MSIKVISVESLTDASNVETMLGWVEFKKFYKEFSVTKKNKIEYRFSFKKASYKSLEHFIGVMGKFNPYTVFFEPIKVPKLTFNYLTPLLKLD